MLEGLITVAKSIADKQVAMAAIAVYMLAVAVGQAIRHIARFAELVAFTVVTVNQPAFVRLLASVEAEPTVLAAIGLTAFVTRLVRLEVAVIVRLVMLACAKQHPSTAATIVAAQVVSPSSAFSSQHPVPSCASFYHSLKCTSSHNSQVCDRLPLEAMSARTYSSSLHPLQHVPVLS